MKNKESKAYGEYMNEYSRRRRRIEDEDEPQVTLKPIGTAKVGGQKTASIGTAKEGERRIALYKKNLGAK
jgi:hypothetical protein